MEATVSNDNLLFAYLNGIIKGGGGGGGSYKKWIFIITNFYEGWIYKCNTHSRPPRIFQKWKCSYSCRGHDPYYLQGSTEPLGSGFCPLVRFRNVPLTLKPISKAALFADRVSGTNKHDDSTQSPTITKRATQSPRAQTEGEREREMKEIPLPQSS